MQRFILSLSGARAGDLEAESRAWHIQCPVCGSSKSIWELGGVRYKATSRGKRIRGHCSVCGTRRWMRYVRIDPGVASEAGDGPGTDADDCVEGELRPAADHPADAAIEPDGDHDTDRANDEGDDGPPG